MRHLGGRVSDQQFLQRRATDRLGLDFADVLFQKMVKFLFSHIGVTAMMRVGGSDCSASILQILRAASRPSMTGIEISIGIRSDRNSRQISTAS